MKLQQNGNSLTNVTVRKACDHMPDKEENSYG